nr:MAG TPA: hypothetical protein [Siphoviridae sp. ct8TV20]
MDEFDVIDIVFNAVDSANTGIVIYKDRSEAGIKTEHIVINSLSLNELTFVNKTPVNVNIFIPVPDSKSRMPDRKLMKEVKRAIRESLNAINCSDGHYKNIEVFESSFIPEAKENFDCVNIRLNVITE